MLNINECKKHLKEDSKNYSDETIKTIRDLLYKLGQIEYANLKKKSYGKRNNLYKGIH